MSGVIHMLSGLPVFFLAYIHISSNLMQKMLLALSGINMADLPNENRNWLE